MDEKDKELQELRRENERLRKWVEELEEQNSRLAEDVAHLRLMVYETAKEEGDLNLVISKAIERYGVPLQTVVAMEEMAELQKELSKAIRGYIAFGKVDNTSGILEEVADVRIMLSQIAVMYDIHEDEVKEVMRSKLMRLNSRL